MEENYRKAYVEALEILTFMPEESVNKIPKDIIEVFKLNKDENYRFEVDIDKTFEEQEVLEETKAILANFFRDYWATPEQKEKIEAKERYDRQKIEEEKRERYNPDDIFKNRKAKIQNTIVDEQVENYSANLPAEIKQGFFDKVINFFKRMFNIG